MNPQLKQVIVTDITTRGNGSTTPMRTVCSVYETDGTKLAEYDPCSYTIEEIRTILFGLVDDNKLRRLFTK